MLSTFRSLHWLRSLLLPLALLSLTVGTVACGGSTPSPDAETEAAADDGAPSESQEPAQFRDGFESGDTSGWSGEGDGDEASENDAVDDPPPAADG